MQKAAVWYRDYNSKQQIINSSISKINSAVQWSKNIVLYLSATKSATKECHHSKYHHQMVSHITVLSNTLTYMIRVPFGTLGIKFRDRKMFILRNRLNRLMSYKLNYTNQKILYAFDIYQQRFLIEWGINIFIFLPYISYTDTVLAVFYTPVWKTVVLCYTPRHPSVCKLFRFHVTPPTVYVRLSWNLVYSKAMRWFNAYYLQVEVQRFLAELQPFN